MSLSSRESCSRYLTLALVLVLLAAVAVAAPPPEFAQTGAAVTAHQISSAPAAAAHRALIFTAGAADASGPQNRRGIRILSKRFRISLCENLNHPVVEVIDGIFQNRAETAVVFLAGFIEIVA